MISLEISPGVAQADDLGARWASITARTILWYLRQRVLVAVPVVGLVGARGEPAAGATPDGAQQRLVSLALTLRMAREKLGPDAGEAGRLLERSRQELDEALKEIRELARGIHPTVLSDRGLRAAVEALAHRAPLPVEVGERVLRSVMLGMRESDEDWLALARDLIARGPGAPMLIVADGAPGLINAVEQC
jgi:Histidine kinase